ncbi:Macrophage scavenger receptor types I and II [Holothuria leucospilota]|uniref:Macrophage scavenger receptor types I and II n=1 Tax=Holothuria leucospilota TaxID=206669 RepID=A0A9Q0YCU8_HOLLE|nr:Macrophage scavenger receptor types I and II [Holothuria leucospilota]
MNRATELLFKCEGYESSLVECAQLDIEDYQDSFYSYVQYVSKNIAQVACGSSTFEPTDYVRLVEGDGYYGSVEVLFEGVWHRTCDDHWTKLEGGVICRQLGFRGVHSVTHNPTHENETTTTHPLRFTCHGYEESLTDCVQQILASNSSNNIGGCYSDANITCLLDKSIPGEFLLSSSNSRGFTL